MKLFQRELFQKLLYHQATRGILPGVSLFHITMEQVLSILINSKRYIDQTLNTRSRFYLYPQLALFIRHMALAEEPRIQAAAQGSTVARK